MTSSDVLEVSVHIEAAPETVFGFFTDPTRYTKWMGSEATIEAVPGGLYRVHMRDGVEAVGQFVEVDPPKRVVFTWGWHGDEVVGPGSTRVEIILSPVGDSTDVVLRHFGLPGAEQIEHHRQGWELYLGRLAAAAAGVDPGPDPNA
ncbi:MAG: SRPBCC domain-containing protein [Nocardioidaceae bacterium]